MELTTGSVPKLFRKFLYPSLFSGIVTSIYVLVDMIVVGQYEGELGAAAMACNAPFWPLFCCISLLFGLPGSVLFSREKGAGDPEESNRWFTAACICMGAVLFCVWMVILLADRWLLTVFGADEEILPLALRYMKWLKWGVPLYPAGLFLGMFVRSDGEPGLAGGSVIAGGILNIIGDVFLTFTCDLGIEGAAIASVVGQALADVILAVHFFKGSNTLRLVPVDRIRRRTGQLLQLGFAPFLGDVSMSFLTILFNNQVMRLFGATELAIYGIGSNIFTTLQTLSYGAGSAAQPIMAQNLGAGKPERVKQAALCGIRTALILGVAMTALMLIFPEQLSRLYMSATEEVYAAAVPILRRYFLCLTVMPVNVFATYALQAVLQVRSTVMVSLLRGVVCSGILVYLMPALLGAGALWYVMLAAEVITCVFAVVYMRRYIFTADTYPSV